MTQWEYSSCNFQSGQDADPFGSTMEFARTQGLKGWEMVNHSVTFVPSTQGAWFEIFCVMKRPKAPPEDI